MVPRSMGSKQRATSNCACKVRHSSTSCLASAFAFSLAPSAVGLGCNSAQRSQSCSRSV